MEEENKVVENNLEELSNHEENQLSNIELEETTPQKNKIITYWQSLETKNKILIAFVIILFIVLITVIILALSKDEETKTTPKEEEKESVVLEKDNYIYQDGILKILNDTNEVGEYTCHNQDEETCYLAYMSSETSLNNPIRTYEDETPVKIPSKYYNGIIFVIDGEADNIIMYDLNEELVINTYKEIKTIIIEEKSYIILKDKNDLYGLYDPETDEMIYDVKYTNIDHLEGQKNIVLIEDNKSYIANLEGEKESSAISGVIKAYNDQYITYYEYRNYTLVDYKNKAVTDEKFDFIALSEDYFTTVSYNNLFISSYDLVKYNLDGIKLDSEDFITQLIYNQDGELIKEVHNFQSELKDNIITLTVYKEDEESETKLNIDDAIMSEDLVLHNYMNGKLYFYKDEAKTELIGSYTCQNENDSSSKKLSSCFPAMDTNYSNSYEYESSSVSDGYLPIINNKYVFISDTEPGSTMAEIKLYDLKAGNTITTYYGIDIIQSNKTTLTHLQTSGVELIATNQNHEFGVIELSDAAKGIYPFNYDYISKVGKGYTTSKGTVWSYIDEEDRTHGPFDGPVVAVSTSTKHDTLVAVNVNELDFVYDLDGNLLNIYGFKKIHFSTNDLYYAGTVNDTVSVFDNYGNDTSINNVKFNLPSDSTKEILNFPNDGTINIIDGDTYRNYTIKKDNIIYGS